MRYFPTATLEALLTTTCFDPEVAPDRMSIACAGFGSAGVPRLMAPSELPKTFRIVFWGPAPLRVMLLGTVILELIRNVPAESETTPSFGHPLRADCIAAVASVVPLPKFVARIVAQTVVRFGTPPGTPTWLQSMPLLLSKIPCHGFVPFVGPGIVVGVGVVEGDGEGDAVGEGVTVGLVEKEPVLLAEDE